MTGRELRRLLARNIRQTAKKKHVTLNALADFAGVSRSQLYDVLALKKGVTLDWLAKVARGLDVHPHQLIAPDSKP